MVELRLLKYFVTVAEELHFGRAAKRLNMSQPPLSQQIQQLERQLDTQLFNRTSRQTELTPAGSVLLPLARRMLTDAEQVEAAVVRAARGEFDTLHVGFTDSAALSILPEVVRSFRDVQPDVHLELSESSTKRQLERVENGEIDIALVRGPIANPALRVETVLREGFLLALPARHRLSGRKSIALSEVADEQFVLFARHLAAEYYDQLITICRRAGFSPDVRAEGSEYQTMLSLVAADLGVTIVPRSVRNLGRAGVSYVSLRDVRSKATIVMVSRPQHSSAALRQFSEVCRSLRASFD